MSFRTIMMRTAAVAVLALWCAAVLAQTPAPSPAASSSKKGTSQTRPGQRAAEKRLAPQVVTIVHRINALKMFRALLRSQQQVQGVSALGSTFNLTDDVHANVIAGLAMEDGATIAAWL